MFDFTPGAVREKALEVHRLSSLTEIERWVADNPYLIYYLGRVTGAQFRNPRSWYEVPDFTDSVRLTFHGGWNAYVRNSHSCPKDGVVNHSRDQQKPRWYPGYSGFLRWWVPKEWGDFYLNAVLRYLRIHTGSGSAGNDVYGRYCGEYSFEIFDADYPVMAITRNLVG